MVGRDPFGPVTDKWLQPLEKLRTMSRPKKIKTAIWVGEKQWQALKALADSLDRTAAQLVPKLLICCLRSTALLFLIQWRF